MQTSIDAVVIVVSKRLEAFVSVGVLELADMLECGNVLAVEYDNMLADESRPGDEASLECTGALVVEAGAKE